MCSAWPPPASPCSRQLGAFAEEPRARACVERWRAALPDLRLAREEEPGGAVLWKVRLGDFARREQAQERADRLRRVQGLSAIVVEAGGDAGAGR